MNDFDYCVFIGRFSPFHIAHLEILKKALQISKHVIVVIGSSSSSRNTRNPWTADERKIMISSSLSEDELKRVSFVFMRDYKYNDNMWFSILQEKISKITQDSSKIALIGFESDETSFYLKMFPQFTFIEHKTNHVFHAENIRDLYFSMKDDYKSMVANGVFNFMEYFKDTIFFKDLVSEHEHVIAYKKSWSNSPFPPMFVTVDTIVMKSGHILIIRRGHNPGKGLLALPGGFVNQKEKIEDGALRELKEETNIKLNIAELRKNIVDRKVFDDPSRSPRGRMISHSFLIDLGAGPLPKVKAGDDAADAFWLPLNEYYTLEDSFFADHFHIIRSLISKY